MGQCERGMGQCERGMPSVWFTPKVVIPIRSEVALETANIDRVKEVPDTGDSKGTRQGTHQGAC